MTNHKTTLRPRERRHVLRKGRCFATGLDLRCLTGASFILQLLQ